MAIRVLNLTNPPSNFVAFTSNVTSKTGKFFVAAGFATRKSVTTKIVETSSCLSRLWKEVQGLHKFVDEPLDPLLQHEIVRYGEFVAACYQAFDLNPESKRYLNSKYGKNSMLNEIGMPNSGYEVTKYIYATPDINILPTQNIAGRWIGYVAVSSDEQVNRLGRRDVMVAFRGTVTYQEWLANFMSSLTPARLDPHNPRPDVKVGAGVLRLYTSSESDHNKFGLGSCREQLLWEVTRLLNKYRGEEISITLAGHSMGSSLALLLAYDIAELQLNKDYSNNELIPITVLSFGGPRVGNLGFKERCDELGLNVLRIVNVNDPITKIPGVVFNENFKVDFPLSCSCYAHVGIEIALDFLKMRNPSRVHDIDTYLSLLRSCPRKGEIKKKGLHIVDKVKRFLSSRPQTLEWREAAMNMVSMVQSHRT